MLEPRDLSKALRETARRLRLFWELCIDDPSYGLADPLLVYYLFWVKPRINRLNRLEAQVPTCIISGAISSESFRALQDLGRLGGLRLDGCNSGHTSTRRIDPIVPLAAGRLGEVC